MSLSPPLFSKEGECDELASPVATTRNSDQKNTTGKMEIVYKTSKSLPRGGKILATPKEARKPKLVITPSSTSAMSEIGQLLSLLYQTAQKILDNSIFMQKLRGMTKSQAIFFAMMAFLLYHKDSISLTYDGPIVKTKQGYLQGTESISRGGRYFEEYLNIPYAKPPVGHLRFEPPEPPESWDGIRDATQYGNKCVQIDLLLGVIGGSEDCLQINLYVPVRVPGNRRKKDLLPVIMYIHGGFFHNGGAAFWRPTYFMDEDVILAVPQYRLNSLGFLNTDDGVIRGNMGLKDQVMALRWLRENVEAFGGDPSRITILGESAGGSASHLHMFSKMSRGLFNNVISESGTGLHFWAVNSEPRKQAIRFLKQLGCPYQNKTEMVSCLKSADPYAIAEIHREVLDPLREAITIYKPSIEVFINDGNTFLSEHPKELVGRGDFNKAAWISGVNSQEGLITSAAILANATMAEVAKSDWKLFIERVLWYNSSTGISAEKIRNYYFGNFAAVAHPDPFQTLDNYTNMISDRGFNFDAHHGALLQSKYSPVYTYFYSYRGEWSAVNYFKEIKGAWPRLVEVAWAIAAAWIRKQVLNQPLTNYGASHSDELSLLFQMPLASDVTPNCNDYEMSVDLIKLWVHFAEDRKPLYFRGVEWEPINPYKEPLRYLKLDRTAEMIDEPFSNRIKFWDALNIDETRNL